MTPPFPWNSFAYAIRNLVSQPIQENSFDSQAAFNFPEIARHRFLFILCMKIGTNHPERIELESRTPGMAKAAQLLLPVLWLLGAVQVALAQIPEVTVDPVTKVYSTY